MKIIKEEIDIYECEVCGRISRFKDRILGCEQMHEKINIQNHCKHSFEYEIETEIEEDVCNMQILLHKVCSLCEYTETREIYLGDISTEELKRIWNKKETKKI